MQELHVTDRGSEFPRISGLFTCQFERPGEPTLRFLRFAVANCCRKHTFEAQNLGCVAVRAKSLSPFKMAVDYSRCFLSKRTTAAGGYSRRIHVVLAVVPFSVIFSIYRAYER